MLPLYNAFIQIYFNAIRLASFWNKKAAAWVEGRKNVFAHLQKNISGNDKIIWMHCSSAGEFEQGKPMIEALKKTYPQKKVLVTFFSPSGFSVAKNYFHADLVTYLPLDTPKQADHFFNLVKPELVIFVKYEYWYHHLSVAAFHRVPILLISAAFRPDQIFFKPSGRFFKRMLFLFRYIFVQDKGSLELLQKAGIHNCNIAGDTRFDRVQTIVQKSEEVPFIGEFVAGNKVIVAGSTWPGDEEALAELTRKVIEIKLIIAPHEINKAHLDGIQALFKGAALYSSLEANSNLHNTQVLIVDSVGLLSRLYRYASIAYVGGGFTKDGIHNILEAAVWAKPVIFGPNYKKYREAKELIEAGGAFHFSSANELKNRVGLLLTNEKHLREAGANAKNYVEENTGATSNILEFIQENRLLTKP